MASKRSPQQPPPPRTAPAARPPARAGRSRSRPAATDGRRHDRRAWFPIGLTLATIAVLVGAFVLIRYATAPAPAPIAGQPDSGRVVAEITSLPAAELEQVGLGSARGSLARLPGPLWTGAGGKPVVLYVGAEYCPYCAAERWAMIVALSRFGTYGGLNTTTSAANDVYPNTPTFTFRGATYTSDYIDFQAVEEYGNQPQPEGGYNRLQTLTPEQQALLARYDAPPYTSTPGAIPFVDFANVYGLSGATYTNDVLVGRSWQQVSDALHQPGSAQAQAILGSSNLLTAAVCQATGRQPAQVCSLPGIQSIEKSLPKPS